MMNLLIPRTDTRFNTDVLKPGMFVQCKALITFTDDESCKYNIPVKNTGFISYIDESTLSLVMAPDTIECPYEKDSENYRHLQKTYFHCLNGDLDKMREKGQQCLSITIHIDTVKDVNFELRFMQYHGKDEITSELLYSWK